MFRRIAITISGLLGILLGVCGPALADTVYLKNGAWIDGIVRTRNSEVIQVDIGDIGKIEIPLEEVYEIEKNSRTGSRSSLSVAGRKLGIKVDAGKKSDTTEGEKAPDGNEEHEDEEDEEGRDEGRDELEEEPIDPELKERIEELINDLTRQKSRYRVRAQRHLKAIGAPAIPYLAPLARHESELVRVAVFRLFHSFGDDRVIEDCIEALVDGNEYVRDYAHRALRRVTGESFGYKPFASPRRRETAYRKWVKWWSDEKALLEELEEQAR